MSGEPNSKYQLTDEELDALYGDDPSGGPEDWQHFLSVFKELEDESPDPKIAKVVMAAASNQAKRPWWKIFSHPALLSAVACGVLFIVFWQVKDETQKPPSLQDSKQAPALLDELSTDPTGADQPAAMPDTSNAAPADDYGKTGAKESDIPAEEVVPPASGIKQKNRGRGGEAQTPPRKADTKLEKAPSGKRSIKANLDADALLGGESEDEESPSKKSAETNSTETAKAARRTRTGSDPCRDALRRQNTAKSAKERKQAALYYQQNCVSKDQATEKK